MPETIPPHLVRLLFFLQLFSLGMFSMVLVWWRRRIAHGDSITNTIQTTWNGPAFLRLMGILILLYSQTLLATRLLGGQLKTDSQKVLLLITMQGVIYVFFLLLVRNFIREHSMDWNQSFGFRTTGLKTIIPTAMIALSAVLIPVEVFTGITILIFKWMGWPMTPQPILEIFENIKNPAIKGGVILIAIAGAPLVEELLFRGILYPFLKNKFGFRNALWLTSFLFAAFHLHLPSLLPLFVLAVAFTLLYEWTGSLIAPILMHAGFNSMSLGLLLLKEHWL